jgi:CBS domain containing-hemolysin-like protein
MTETAVVSQHKARLQKYIDEAIRKHHAMDLSENQAISFSPSRFDHLVGVVTGALGASAFSADCSILKKIEQFEACGDYSALLLVSIELPISVWSGEIIPKRLHLQFRRKYHAYADSEKAFQKSQALGVLF